MLLDYDLPYEEKITNSLNRLLNMTRTHDNAFKAYPEIEKSILNMGLPTLDQYTLSNQTDQKNLANEIKQQIDWFEPRIKATRVEVDATTKRNQPVYNFKIYATAIIDGEKKSLTFDSELDAVNERFEVHNEKGDDG